MKFVYDGDYAVRDGVTFLFRNPTTVDNKSTIQRLLRDPEFQRVDDLPSPETIIAAKKFLEEVNVEPRCPRCQRVFHKGLVMHTRFCKA
jgi:hypothetical protein